MTFQKYKYYYYCVGGRHHSSATNILGDITTKGSKVFIGNCSLSNRKKCMTVSNNTILAERLPEFFKHLFKKGLNV